MNTYDSGVSKLSIFKDIHAMGPDDEDDLMTLESDCSIDDDSLSLSEIEEDIRAFCFADIKPKSFSEEESAMNTTVESSQESSTSVEDRKSPDEDTLTQSKAYFFKSETQINMKDEICNSNTFEINRRQSI